MTLVFKISEPSFSTRIYQGLRGEPGLTGPTGPVGPAGPAGSGSGGSLDDGDKGDITVSSSGTVWSVDTGVITYAKLQTLAASRLLGNPTTGTIAASEISLGSTLAFSGAGLQTVAGAGGDVTWPANSFSATIAANVVSAAKFRQSAALSVVGNPTSATANVSDVAGVANQILRVNSTGTELGFGQANLSSSATVTGTLAVGFGGTGAVTLTQRGILIGEGASAIAATAAMSDGQLLVGQTGADPLPKSISGDATVAATGAVTVANDAVTFAKFQNISTTQRVVGLNGAGPGNAEELSVNQLLSWLGTTRGALLRYGVAGWEIMNPGTAGTVLMSNGVGADPSYQSVSGTGTVTSVASGFGLTGGPVTTAGTLALDPAQIGQFGGRRRRNHNGRFQVSQRNGVTPTTTADNAYWADRWRYIGEASASLTASLSGTFSTYTFLGSLAFAGTTDKGGIFSVIEGKDIKDLRGLAVTLSATLAVSNTRIGNVKMAVVEFTGTEDATTADPVTTWGADGVNPTLAAGWAFLNTPANLGVTATAVKYAVNVTLGAATTNVAVMIWNDDKTYTAADVLYFSDVQLEPGTLTAAQAAYEAHSYGDERNNCLRYYYRVTRDAANHILAIMQAYSSTAAFGPVISSFPQPMRIVPTVTVSSLGHFSLWDAAGSAQRALTSGSFNKPTLTSLGGDVTASTGTFTAGHGTMLHISDASGWVAVSADL